jgi:hypothetical protein
MRLLLILLLIPFVFATPPVDDVMDFNNATAPDLEGYYNSSFAENASLELVFGPRTRDLTVSVFVDIAGMNLLVDNMTHPTSGLALITARGYKMEHLVAIASEGYPDFICDLDWFQGGAGFAWRCDFDNDFCTEYENSTSMDYDATVNFTFRNISESVPFSSNVVDVPASVLDAMRDSTGAENLSISIEGNATFTYVINNRSYDGLDCFSVYFTRIAEVPFSVNASFPVAGENKLFFLRAPVLREQWFRNNHFDTIVLSQSPLYHAEIFLDGNTSKDITIREFHNDTDDYGLMRLYSNMTDSSSWSESRNLTMPTPLQQEDHGFAFIYEFNHSYDGIGRHALSLMVEDSFLGSGRYDDVLISRALSHGGTLTEESKPVDDNARRSAVFQKQEITLVEIGLGFVALIIFLSFLNFWMPR